MQPAVWVLNAYSESHSVHNLEWNQYLGYVVDVEIKSEELQFEAGQ